MAEVTPAVEPTPTPVIAKRSEIEQKANEIKERRALPTAPGKLVRFKELQEWLALLNDDAQKRISIWVYRRDPVINRQLVDPQTDNNIDVVFSDFEKLTEEYMKENHGGGNYKFTVKDADKPKTQLGGFFEAVLNIPMLDCPPKLDLREVEWDNSHNKGFKSWCRAKKLIDENNMPVIAKVENGTPPPNGVNESMLKMLLDFTAKMSEKEQVQLKKQIGGEEAATKSMNELFLEKLKQEDPNKQANVMLQMITAMKGMIPEVKPDNTMATLIPLLMKMMDDSRAAADRQITMMLELFKNQNKPAESGGDDLDKLEKLMNIAAKIKGGGHVAEKSTTESLIELGQNILPPVLQVVANITAMNAAAKGVATNSGPVPTEHKQVSQLQQLHEQNTMSQPQHQQLPPANEAAAVIANFGTIILNKLANEGWEFGAWIADGFGDMQAASIAKYGPDVLLQAAKSVPDFWQKVETTYGEAHLRKWLDSFCRYKEIMAEMDKEDEVGNG